MSQIFTKFSSGLQFHSLLFDLESNLCTDASVTRELSCKVWSFDKNIRWWLSFCCLIGSLCDCSYTSYCTWCTQSLEMVLLAWYWILVSIVLEVSSICQHKSLCHRVSQYLKPYFECVFFLSIIYLETISQSGKGQTQFTQDHKKTKLSKFLI